MIKIVLLAVATSSMLVAGGYKIPELSLNSVALSSANVAHASGADTAYYNPANMVFMNDENIAEFDLTYIGLSSSNYEGTVSGTGPYNLSAERENFVIPSLHYVSADIDGARFGLSIVTPFGLTKRWGQEPAKTTAQEFTLKTIEVNPTVALPISDKVGIAVGLRVVHSEGVVRSHGTAVVVAPATTAIVSRDMEGDSIDMGYNIALAYKPTAEFELGLTYRSEINVGIKGNAKLSESLTPSTYNGGTSLSVTLPASLNVAMAYTFPSETTVEFVYERTFWSAYKELDFNYTGTLSAVLTGVFDTTLEKNYQDVSSYRLGITQKLNKTTLMCGIVYDETPIPNKSIGFELPDSDVLALSLGIRYQMTEKINLGLSTLYAPRKNREVSNSSLNGKFTDTKALLVSAGFEYKF